VEIKPEHIETKKVIGRLGAKKVFQLTTLGGLNIVVVAKAEGFETLGLGSHAKIAQHIAKKKEPSIEFTELSKSEDIPVEYFQFCLPKYEALTDAMRKRQGLK